MRQAGQKDKELVMRILTDSFQDNLSVNFLIPQDNRRMSRIKALMDYSFEICYYSGRIYISDDSKACALISFPEQKKTTLKSVIAEIRLIVKSIGLGNIRKAISREKEISRHHPSQNIYYLWFIGVLPEFQNQGFGKKLMDEIFKDSEQMQKPIYLETSTLKNLPWYEKLGFEIYKEIDFGYRLFLLRRNTQA